MSLQFHEIQQIHMTFILREETCPTKLKSFLEGFVFAPILNSS